MLGESHKSEKQPKEVKSSKSAVRSSIKSLGDKSVKINNEIKIQENNVVEKKIEVDDQATKTVELKEAKTTPQNKSKLLKLQ